MPDSRVRKMHSDFSDLDTLPRIIGSRRIRQVDTKIPRLELDVCADRTTTSWKHNTKAPAQYLRRA